jgi:3-deoxy-D-manno-oct-2-ulosonic acid (Kdo) hydroxylase
MALRELKEDDVGRPDRADDAVRALEEGHVLFFRRTPLAIPEEEIEFLRGERQGGGRLHKNIAYRPARDRVTGRARGAGGDAERLRRSLAAYSRAAREFLDRLLPSYAGSWQTDYASFRPFEEEGRDLPPHSRNDRIHVDAFPTRPTHGDRILRIFSNIHADRPREWMSGGTFERLADRYAVSSGLLDAALRRRSWRFGARLLGRLGMHGPERSPYDDFMLRFHDFLKDNEEVQTSPEREPFSFPAGSTWLVYTDMVSHAVLSGRFALEQTMIVARRAMRLPEKAPVAILERLAGRPMARAARTEDL